MVETPTKKKSLSMKPSVRDYFARWSAGERRAIRDIRGHIGGYQAEERFAQHGLLTIEYEERSHNYSGKLHTWQEATFATRTDVPVREYKPRADPIYPWNEEMHWRAVLDTPWRTIAKITQQLEGRTHRTAEELALDPWLIRERGELRLLRDAVHALFTGQKPDGKQYTSHLTNGYGIRSLLLEMLIEPTFDANGKFTGFVAIDPQVAHEARIRLRGVGDNPVERYHNFVRKNP
jgi:hypothetical protein